MTADTNVLVRAIMEDDAKQARAAQAALAEADVVALALPALCEVVWVLSRAYKVSGQDIGRAINGLLAADNVSVDRPAVDAGLCALQAGGDFADAVIAYEGRKLGAKTFLSFDKRAVAVVRAGGGEAELL